MIKAVIFDLGNTLVKFTGNPDEVNKKGVELMHRVFSLKAIHIEFERLFQAWTRNRINAFREADRTMKEITADEILDKTLDELNITGLSEELKKCAVDAFFTPEIEKYVLMDDAIDTLEYLKDNGKKLGLISNATCHRFVLRLTRKFKIDVYFNEIMTSAGEGIRKPHPEIFKRMLNRLSVKSTESIMVGDMLDYDVVGAKSVGMRAALVVNGKPKPDWIVNNLNELKAQVIKIS